MPRAGYRPIELLRTPTHPTTDRHAASQFAEHRARHRGRAARPFNCALNCLARRRLYATWHTDLGSNCCGESKRRMPLLSRRPFLAHSAHVARCSSRGVPGCRGRGLVRRQHASYVTKGAPPNGSSKVAAAVSPVALSRCVFRLRRLPRLWSAVDASAGSAGCRAGAS